LSETTIARPINRAPRPWRPLLVQALAKRHWSALSATCSGGHNYLMMPVGRHRRRIAGGDIRSTKGMTVLFKQKRIKEK
jgi:hypothetical protein